MGNIDSRCNFDAGYLIVQTMQPFYNPGTMITGTIYLRVTRPINAKHIEIEVKGQEKVSFLEHLQRRHE